MIAPDGSVVAYVLMRMPGSEAVARRLFAGDADLQAPYLLDLEVIQVLRRLHRVGDLDAVQASQVLDDLAHLRVTRHPHHRFSSRIWQLRNNMTAYDAAYVALAEELDAPLLTRDKRLASAPGHHARIELV
jgi:predicted nucleic acid-binding protein